VSPSSTLELCSCDQFHPLLSLILLIREALNNNHKKMNSREQSDLPPAPSYPSPNPAQVGQGTMYYGGRQLTADEILSAELSRDATGGNLADGSSHGRRRV
jgi:hypothetical protein